MDVYWDILALQDPCASGKEVRKVKGSSIREFSLVEPIGTGGYSNVWQARRKRTGDLVAVKVAARSPWTE